VTHSKLPPGNPGRFNPFTEFDDGQPLKPGDPDFDALRIAAQAHFGTDAFSYTGTPNWVPPTGSGSSG